jgi:hypothetical protein
MKRIVLLATIILAIETTASADSVFSAGSQNQVYNNQPLTGSKRERGVVAVAELVGALLATAKPASIYQVSVISGYWMRLKFPGLSSNYIAGNS